MDWNGGPLSISLFNELPLCEYLGCPPSSGWRVEPLGTWICKLVLTCTMVGFGVVTLEENWNNYHLQLFLNYKKHLLLKIT